MTPTTHNTLAKHHSGRKHLLIANLFNGLTYGALLIVMCSGLALIYGLRRVVNFAHGSLYMLGAYIGYSVASHSNFNFYSLVFQ